MSTYLIFIWHGVFLSLTMAMIDMNTIFPALVTDLGGSKVTFGLLFSIMLGAPYLFSLPFGHYIARHRHRRKFLLIGIYLRAAAFFGMAGMTYLFASRAPELVVGSFFFWMSLFSVSGGFAGISYTDIIGKLVEQKERGKLYAAKQLASSIAAFVGGMVVAKVLSSSGLRFPANYSLIFGAGGAGLVIAAIAFWFIREPPSQVDPEARIAFRSLLKRIPGIMRENQKFLRFVIVQNLTSFSLMVMPFYTVFAKEKFAIPDSYVGRYLLFQIGGAILSNLVWRHIAAKRSARAVVRSCIALGGTIPVLAILGARLGPDAFAVIFILVGFVMSGRRVGFDPYTLEIIPEKERPVYLGLQGTMNVLAVAVPFLGGVAIHALGYYPVFGFTAAIMGIAYLLLAR